MMRTSALAIALSLAALAGCGGDGEAVTFASPGEEQDGYPAIVVADEAEADRICAAAQESWPSEWDSAPEAVTLDYPGETDLICVRQE